MMLATALASFLPGPAPPPQAQAPAYFVSEPSRVELTGGGPLDRADGYGHCGPLVLDLDGQGRLDLLVGDLAGNLHAFHAVEGTSRFAPAGPLTSGGEPIRVHNW